MKFRKKRNIIKIKLTMIRTIQIVIGTAILSVGTSLFLLPNQLSSGGFAGLATITYYLFDLPLGTTILVLNIPLFILSLIRNGKTFFINAIFGTVMLSVFLDFFERYGSLTQDRFLACIYGGIIGGIGSAIILKSKSSTRRYGSFNTNCKIIQT